MQAGNRSIENWLMKLGTGEILLPRFQRHEVWGPDTIAAFLTSVVRDLPTGSTLTWDVWGKEPFKSRRIEGTPGKSEEVKELLLDGQQRLTALWRALNSKYRDRTYLVLNPEDKENREVIGVSRWERDGKRYPLWVDEPEECWKRKQIPLRLLNPGNESEFSNWAGKVAMDSKIRDRIVDLRAEIRNYNLPVLSLPASCGKEVATEVFVKLNTTLVRLTAFDIIVAQFEAAIGESLHDLVASLKSQVPKIAYYIEPSNLVLSVSTLLQDKPPNQRGYFSLDLDKFAREDWSKIVKGTKETVQFLGDEKVIDRDRLLIESILAPLIALWAEAPEASDERGNTRILLRKYLWKAFFAERYDRAVPTAVLQDYRILRKVIAGEARETEVPCFDSKEYPLPNKEEVIQSRWPRYKDRLARALLLLTIRGGAEDIKDPASLSKDNIEERHYHHLFPIAWLREKDPNADANIALNCILINRRTNSEILAKKPIKYLLETCEASDLGKSEIRRRLQTHFVDFDLLAQGDYGKFLDGRAKACESAIKSLCDGNAWRP